MTHNSNEKVAIKKKCFNTFKPRHWHIWLVKGPDPAIPADLTLHSLAKTWPSMHQLWTSRLN